MKTDKNFLPTMTLTNEYNLLKNDEIFVYFLLSCMSDMKLFLVALIKPKFFNLTL